jgi:hypothetical protein
MTRIKPRGPTPSLIGSTNGRPRRAPVLKKSKCYRCQDELPTGQDCIEIPKVGSGFSSARRVCKECFKAILEKTKQDLQEIMAL